MELERVPASEDRSVACDLLAMAAERVGKTGMVGLVRRYLFWRRQSHQARRMSRMTAETTRKGRMMAQELEQGGAVEEFIGLPS